MVTGMGLNVENDVSAGIDRCSSIWAGTGICQCIDVDIDEQTSN